MLLVETYLFSSIYLINIYIYIYLYNSLFSCYIFYAFSAHQKINSGDFLFEAEQKAQKPKKIWLEDVNCINLNSPKKVSMNKKSSQLLEVMIV